jgi:hypothetical protein
MRAARIDPEVALERVELLHAEPPRSPEPLDRSPAVVLALSCLIYYSSIFYVKACMFAAQWQGERVLGLDYKSALASAQTLGYLLGKVPAMAFAPKLEREQLLPSLLFVLWAAGLLVVIAMLVPPVLSVLCVFLACMCLSPCWYVLQRAIEGRAHTEAILSVASLSIIGVSGFAKACAAYLLQRGLSDRSMVAFCSIGGVAVGTVAAVVVGVQPPPSASDVRLRGTRDRVVSLRAECHLLVQRYGTGLALSTGAYVLCGMVRAFRDFFQAELLGAIGLAGQPSAFATSELIVSVVVLGATSLFSRIPDNLVAVRIITATAAIGGLLIAGASAGWLLGYVGGYAWIVGTGAGTFLVYVPIGSMLYERLLAAGSEQITATPLTLTGDTAVLLATAVMLASRFGGGSSGDAVVSDESRALENAATARYFAWLALGGGLAAAALVGSGGVTFIAAVRRQRRQVRLRHQKSNDSDGPMEDGAGYDDFRASSSSDYASGEGQVLRGAATEPHAGEGPVQRGGASGDLHGLHHHLSEPDHVPSRQRDSKLRTSVTSDPT